MKLNGSPVGGDHLDAIIGRVRLIEISPLRRYEQTEPEKVSAIEQSVRTRGVLINPVIVDPEHRLLVDGHHRVRAFELLGLTHIPAFTVDYLSDDLTVKGWNHATDADEAELIEASEHLHGVRNGRSALILADPRCRELVDISFPDPWESAQGLSDVLTHLRRRGRTVEPRTEAEAVRRKRNHGYIRPVVGKSDVLESIERDKLFPREINRHLVQDRPLNLRVPVEASLDRSTFQDYLNHLCQTVPLAIKPGAREGERLYEERVTLFRPGRSGIMK